MVGPGEGEGHRDTWHINRIFFFSLRMHFLNVFFIYLAALGLSFGMWNGVMRDLSLWYTSSLVVALGLQSSQAH